MALWYYLWALGIKYMTVGLIQLSTDKVWPIAGASVKYPLTAPPIVVSHKTGELTFLPH